MVLEIVAGIVIGPAVLGLVEVDVVIEVLAVMGLAFLLFLAGLEIDFNRLRGRQLRLAGGGFLLSFALAVVVGFALSAADLVDTPLLVAIILCATSLGVIVPVLTDAGEIGSSFGQFVVAAGSIADFGAIILLSIFFTGRGRRGLDPAAAGPDPRAGRRGLLHPCAGAERSKAITSDLVRLQDTTAQIRVRGAVVLMIGFVALAEAFGLEAILGAFAAARCWRWWTRTSS